MSVFYRRNLPHFQPDGGEFFCTFRLANSLPRKVLKRYKKRVENFKQKNEEPLSSEAKINQFKFLTFDNFLDQAHKGPFWLQKQRIAKIVSNKLHELNSHKYNLRCYCIMPNHVHLLVKLIKSDKSANYPLTQTLKLIKGSTAYQANKELNREGQFWQHESYDHWIRNDKERERFIRYILQNPVKAGLVNCWKDWEWTFCKKNFLPVR